MTGLIKSQETHCFPIKISVLLQITVACSVCRMKMQMKLNYSKHISYLHSNVLPDYPCRVLFISSGHYREHAFCLLLAETTMKLRETQINLKYEMWEDTGVLREKKQTQEECVNSIHKGPGLNFKARTLLLQGNWAFSCNTMQPISFSQMKKIKINSSLVPI